MVPREFLIPYLISNGAALLLLAGAFWRPRVVRWLVVAIFLWACITNASVALVRPEVYLDYGDLTFSETYRDFIAGWFADRIQPMVLTIAFGQLLIAILLAGTFRLRWAGVAGALIFLAAIAPLGVGSAFPFSIAFGAAIVVTHVRLQRGERRRLEADRTPSPLDAFIPKPDIRERHEVVVNASPAVTMAAAEKLDINSLPLVRAIFRLRAWFMQATRPDFKHQPFMDELRGLGWRELARGRDRFFVMGAVTQPWLGDVTFTGIEPSRFAEFAEPDLVKIAWTIETIPMGDGRTLHRTETRVIATDDAARQKFRRYWRWAGFGIVAIRLLIVPAIRRNAERAARRAHTRSFDPAHRRT